MIDASFVAFETALFSFFVICFERVVGYVIQAPYRVLEWVVPLFMVGIIVRNALAVRALLTG